MNEYTQWDKYLIHYESMLAIQVKPLTWKQFYTIADRIAYGVPRFISSHIG